MSSLLTRGGSTSAAHNGANGDDGTSDAAPPSYDAFPNDQSVADGRTPDDLRVPPAEDEIDKVNLTEAFDRLSLGIKPKFPDADTCLAHLKLLFAIQGMKEEVGYTDGLWNIWDTRADDTATVSDLAGLETASAPASGPANDEVSNKKLAILSKIREKRWAIFLARAVDRYEAWWSSLQRPNGGLTENDMRTPRTDKYDLFVSAGNDLIAWDASNLPPLGEYLAT
jgi:hypothetical protein